MMFWLFCIAFLAGDAIAYSVSRHPPFFRGWWIPGSGYYALCKWGLE